MEYIVLADTCDPCIGGDCPKIVQDPETGLVGVQGSETPGSTKEHISWMGPSQLRQLLGQYAG